MIDVQAQRDQMATLRNEVELRQAQLQGVSKIGQRLPHAGPVVAVEHIPT